MDGLRLSKVPQLRITVNSRCQKACFYCRPSGEGSVQFPKYEMSTEEIRLVVSHLARHGITDVKLTGGDPILKDDIVDLVRGIKAIDGIRSVHLVTRHHRAGLLARSLADAGLDCLNFSLDTLQPDRFLKITGSNSHKLLLTAIEKSVAVSRDVKINTVVMAGINSDELFDLVDYAEKVGIHTLKFLDLILDMETDNVSFAKRLEMILPGKSFESLYSSFDDFRSTKAESR